MINFVLPLTLSVCQNALYIESRPGAEDWHPVLLDYGKLKRFFGALCVHWTPENCSDATRVSLDFRVFPAALFDGTDRFSSVEGYFQRARRVNGEYVRVGDAQLLAPDKRNGLPF